MNHRPVRCAFLSVLVLFFTCASTVAQPAAATDPKPPAKRELRYEGKTFAEYREEFLSNIDPKIRLKSLKAMAVFARHGKAAATAATILEMAEELNETAASWEKLMETNPRFSFDREADEKDDDILEECAKLLIQMPAVTVPLLRNCLKESTAPGPQVLALESIAVMGPSARDAIPDLIKLANGKRLLGRCGALVCLAAIGQDDERVVPNILAALKDKSAAVRISGMRAMAKTPGLARNSVASILEAASDPACPISEEVWSALDAAEAGAKGAPLVMKMIQNVDRRKSQSRADIDALLAAYRYLGRLGPQAKGSLPGLLERLDYWSGRPDDRKSRTVVYVSTPLFTPAAVNSDVQPVRSVRYEPIDEFVQAVQVIKAIGPGAKESLGKLKKLQETESPERQAAIRAALRSIQGLPPEPDPPSSLPPSFNSSPGLTPSFEESPPNPPLPSGLPPGIKLPPGPGKRP